MGAHLITILADCAFDPSHPNAPCNDTPGPPLLEQPAFWFAVVLCMIVAVWFLRRRSRSE